MAKKFFAALFFSLAILSQLALAACSDYATLSDCSNAKPVFSGCVNGVLVGTACAWQGKSPTEGTCGQQPTSYLCASGECQQSASTATCTAPPAQQAAEQQLGLLSLFAPPQEPTAAPQASSAPQQQPSAPVQPPAPPQAAPPLNIAIGGLIILAIIAVGYFVNRHEKKLEKENG